MVHRATALALTAAMVASMSAPAFAGWTIDMSQVKGDVTIEKDKNGTVTVSIDGDDKTGVTQTEGDDITIKDSRNSGNGSSAGGGMFNNIGGLTEIDLDKSDTSNISGTTDLTKTLEADEPIAPVVTEETTDDITYTEPTPVVTWPDETADPEPENEETTDPEEPESTEEQPEAPAVDEENETPEGEPAPLPAGGETPENLVSTLEAPAPAVPVSSSKDNDDDSNAVTYESKTAAQQVKGAVQEAIKHVIKIINNSKDTLNVTLENVNISGEDTRAGRDALTVIGTGDTTLTLKGENELKGGRGKDGLHHDQTSRDDKLGSLTITSKKNGDGTYQGSLTATGGDGNTSVGRGIYSNGNLTIAGGAINATGGNGNTFGGDGIQTNGTAVTILDGNVTARGGERTGTDDRDIGIGGNGICGGSVSISGGTINAFGGKAASRSGGNGISADSMVDITGGTIEATGGDGGNGGYGILSGSTVNIGTEETASTATIKKAQGGNSTGENGTGGAGICASSKVFINGGTVENAIGGNATGENGKGGSGINAGTTISVEGNSAVKATAGSGSTNGSAFKQGNTELAPADVVKSKTAYAAAVDADGNTTTQGTAPKGFPGYVEPEPEPTPTPAPVSSDGDSAPAPEAIVITPAGVPGFSFTGLLGGSATVSTSVSGSTMEFRLLTPGGTMRTTLGQLRTLRAQGITHITFKTLLRTTTFAINDLLPLGDDAAEVVVSHIGTSAKVMVDGVVR